MLRFVPSLAIVFTNTENVTNLKWSPLGSKVFTYFRQNAVCLADVDNDGEYEMVIGNSAGDLAIFKGTGKNLIPFYVTQGIQAKIKQRRYITALKVSFKNTCMSLLRFAALEIEHGQARSHNCHLRR